MRLAQRRRALITGGASGFGLDIARRMHRAGAGVAVVDIASEETEEVASELGPRAVGISADVRSMAEMAEAVDKARSALGGLDTVVVSAGVFHIGELGETSEEQWDRTIDVNLKGAFTTIQAATPLLRASGRGRIVTIGSDCGRRGFARQVPYTASKFGLVGLTEAVAAELAPYSVTANCVCPVGCPSTAMGQEVLDWKMRQTGLPAEGIMATAALTNPLGRNATETDVTEAVLYFISEHASFMTGVTLDVDGGASLGAVPGVR